MNAMLINDEIIACYLEGTLNVEERNDVRQYLSEHPEKLESVLYAMDDFVECCPAETEESDNIISIDESSFYDIAYSAAAFVPQQKKEFTSINKKLDKPEDFLGRLGSLCDEVGI